MCCFFYCSIRKEAGTPAHTCSSFFNVQLFVAFLTIGAAETFILNTEEYFGSACYAPSALHRHYRANFGYKSSFSCIKLSQLCDRRPALKTVLLKKNISGGKIERFHSEMWWETFQHLKNGRNMLFKHCPSNKSEGVVQYIQSSRSVHDLQDILRLWLQNDWNEQIPVTESVGKGCFCLVNGTYCENTEPKSFNRDWFSHKFWCSGLWYKTAVSICIKNTILIHGLFSSRPWPNVKIFKNSILPAHDETENFFSGNGIFMFDELYQEYLLKIRNV